MKTYIKVTVLTKDFGKIEGEKTELTEKTSEVLAKLLEGDLDCLVLLISENKNVVIPQAVLATSLVYLEKTTK